MLFPFFGYGQCDVTNITFGAIGECDEETNLFKIPVRVEYNGNPDKLIMEIEDADYSYTPQEYEPYEMEDWVFLIYNASSGLSGSFKVRVTVIGGSCTGQNMEKVNNYTAPPACDNQCPGELVLSGVLSTDENYEASNTIESSQSISGQQVFMGATNSVTLRAGFSYTPSSGKSLLINNQGCTN